MKKGNSLLSRYPMIILYLGIFILNRTCVIGLDIRLYTIILV